MTGVAEGVGGEAAGAVRDKFLNEALQTVGVSAGTAESLVNTYGSLETGFELLVDLGVALEPSGHGGARFLGKWIVKGGVMLNNSVPFPQSQPLANNPITRISSGMSPQNIAQSFQQNAQVQQVKAAFTGATPLFNAPGSSTATTTGGGAGNSRANGAPVANSHATGVNRVQVTPTASPTGPTQNRTSSNQGGGSSPPLTGPVRPPVQPPSPQPSVFSRIVNAVRGWFR